MLHYIHRIWLISLLFMVNTALFSQIRLDSLSLPYETAIEPLQQKGNAQSSGDKAAKISLMPQGQLTQNLQQSLDTLKIKSFVESLYLLPNTKQGSQLALYKALMNITSLKGLEFYSRSEKQTKELIYDVYFVDSFENKNRIDNPTPQTLLPHWSGVMMQDDETFGSKYYLVNIYTSANEILMTTQNLEKLTQGAITTAKPKEMITAFYLIQTTEGLLLYQIVATTQGIPGFVQKKAHASLFNRQEAYKNWIAKIYPK
ncbi:hypothetical protein PVA45_02210 [Entomospira entomophila]|uniref:Uncharacterized protein n=1 Tax=Entomospira entomophila TaxID=2719988 RepID=A0A968G845_9SPIO|nr:DUF6675 family protein [Entomospira entomophilus]NIZ40325.1 hypothetical protein [Entomospira entomophilus]WDI35884.1 hypothetical protein PVA45_02210 [Entomospira entomophilus]